MWKDENIKWGSLGKDFWIKEFLHNKSIIEIRKFLKEKGLEYADVPRCIKCHHAFHKCICFNRGEKARIRKLKNKLDEELHKPFNEKLAYSEEIVREVLDEHKGEEIVLAYSGGIDSECCIQLFKDAIVKGLITVVIGDTLVEFPETRKRWAELQKEIPSGKFVIARPYAPTEEERKNGKIPDSFKTVVERYGLPIKSRGSARLKDREPTKMCCKLLKKDPMKKATKGAQVQILGLRKEENQYRGMIIFRMGNYFYSKALKTWRVYPIAYWTIEDVWKFQKKIGFNYNEIYDKIGEYGHRGFFRDAQMINEYQIRSGCWCCPQSIYRGYLAWLQRYYPQYHKALLDSLGLRQVLEILKLKEKEPCGGWTL